MQQTILGEGGPGYRLNQTPGSMETLHIVAQTNKDFLLSDTQSVDLENYELSK